MDQRNARQLIAQYRDGYARRRRSAAEDHAGGARRAARPRTLDAARDRAPPRRQRDDRRRAAAPAARGRPARHLRATTRTEFARRLHYDRPHESSLELFQYARLATAELLELHDRGGMAARGHAHRDGALPVETLAEDLRRARPQARATDPRGARRGAAGLSVSRAGTAGAAAGTPLPARPRTRSARRCRASRSTTVRSWSDPYRMSIGHLSCSYS